MAFYIICPIRIPSPSDDLHDTESLLVLAIRKRRRQKTMVLTMAGLNLDTPISASGYDSVWQSSNVKPDEKRDEDHSDGNTPII